MWNENDQMMKLVERIGQGNVTSPTKCPECGKTQAHYFFHVANEASGKGTAWIWCDECKSYSHFSYFIPKWWKNPEFIDSEELDSSVTCPHSFEKEIDDWVNALISRG